MSLNNYLEHASKLEHGSTDFSTSSQSGQPDSQVAGQIQPDERTRDTRRNLTDRRRPSLKSFIYGALNPRRRRIRRDEDRDHIFLDWHPAHLLIVCALILLLSVIDGLFTVHLINAGVKEVLA